MSQWARSKQDWQLTKFSIKERISELLKLSQWTDCTFSVGEEDTQIISCHKLVLAASSPVFEALFFGGLSQPSEIIRIPDVEPYIFRLFLNYIYSDTLDLQNIQEAGGLLYVAKKYIMPQLSEVCLCYLLDNTCIRTLWDILAIAEPLDEDELIAECLKVMSKFSYKIWSTDGNSHLSKNMLLRLLDLQEMYMKEIDLFEFLLHWAQKECEYEGLDDHSDNIRLCLHSSGALSKIRFLGLSPSEFSETVVPSGVLNEAECLALESLIYNRPVDEKVIAGASGFLLNGNPRIAIHPIIRTCTRDISSGHRLSFENCSVQANITSTARVLVHGFLIATRMSSGRFKNQFYREHLVALVKDEHDNILSKADCMSKDVPFNTNQHLELPCPVWFEPGVKYVLHCDYAAGLYPLTHYSELALAKGTSFKFNCWLEGRNVCCCFLNSICYSY